MLSTLRLHVKELARDSWRTRFGTIFKLQVSPTLQEVELQYVAV